MATRSKQPAQSARSRVALSDNVEGDDHLPSYFASGNDKTNLKFVSTGCAVLDEALGGGLVLGRVANVVGDKSTGKTLLVMEACANFAHEYENGLIRYDEAEAAFDLEYADALGFPVDRIEMNPEGQMTSTVEQLYESLLDFYNRCTKLKVPGIYVIDSLDSISDEAELKADFDAGSYGGTKPKQIGKMFRLLVEKLHEADILFIIVSQIRDKINAMAFGEKYTRSGGRALDFYSTHIFWLADLGKMSREVGGIKRVVGIDIRAKVKKNKIGLAHRECDYPILFGYGIDDLAASVGWLFDNKCDGRLKEIGITSKAGGTSLINKIRNEGGAEAREMREQLRKIVREEWQRIETTFLPKSKKY